MHERINTTEVVSGNVLIHQVEDLAIFLEQPYTIVPTPRVRNLMGEMHTLANGIIEVSEPQSFYELVMSELKRRLITDSMYLSRYTKEEFLQLNEVIDTYGISWDDVEQFEGWLDENTGKVEALNDRLSKESREHRSSVPIGSFKVRYEAEKVLDNKITSLRNFLSNSLADQPGVIELLKDYRFVADFIYSRSYHDGESKIVGFSTSKILYMRDGQVCVDEAELIRIFGHEVLGHTRQQVVTEGAEELPYFLRTKTGYAIDASGESISQYFQDRIFDYLLADPEAADGLGFDKPFEQIYQDYQNTQLLRNYWRNLEHFGIVTLARSSESDSKNQIDTLLRYSVDKSWPVDFVFRHRGDWDRSTGRLVPRIVHELRYSANPVGRIMSGVAIDKIAVAEGLILRGFWTPRGLEQWVNFNLEDNHQIK